MDSELTSEASVKAIDQGLATTDSPTFAGLTSNGDIVFEGATADDFETTLTVTDPTADRTITLPDNTGTVVIRDSDNSVGNAIKVLDGPNSGSTYDGVVTLAGSGEGYLVGTPSAGEAKIVSSRTGATSGNLQIYGTNTSDKVSFKRGIVSIEANSGFEFTDGTNDLTVDHSTLTADQTITLPDQTGTAMLWQSPWPDDPSTTGGNLAIGTSALINVSTGYQNVAIGRNSSPGITTGIRNTAVGVEASDTTTGSYNTSVGYGGGPDGNQANNSYQTTLGSNARAAGDYTVSIGYEAVGRHYLNYTDSSYSIFIGRRSGYEASGANNNVMVGAWTGDGSLTGDNNCAVGQSSLSDLTTGSNNSCYGYLSGFDLTTSSANTMLGAEAGRYTTTGSNHTFVGYQAGGVASTNFTGTNCIAIGSTAEPSSATANNEITLGNSSIATLRCNVTTISSLSDQRDKTDIEDIGYGLDFINSMRPVQFTWDKRDGTRSGVTDIGFIAQELADVEYQYSSGSRTRLVQVYPDKFEADYVRTYPILVKAVQELSAKIEQLETRISQLEGQ
jgi:hypothetical protein